MVVLHVVGWAEGDGICGGWHSVALIEHGSLFIS